MSGRRRNCVLMAHINNHIDGNHSTPPSNFLDDQFPNGATDGETDLHGQPFCTQFLAIPAYYFLQTTPGFIFSNYGNCDPFFSVRAYPYGIYTVDSSRALFNSNQGNWVEPPKQALNQRKQEKDSIDSKNPVLRKSWTEVGKSSDTNDSILLNDESESRPIRTRQTSDSQVLPVQGKSNKTGHNYTVKQTSESRIEGEEQPQGSNYKKQSDNQSADSAARQHRHHSDPRAQIHSSNSIDQTSHNIKNDQSADPPSNSHQPNSRIHQQLNKPQQTHSKPRQQYIKSHQQTQSQIQIQSQSRAHQQWQLKKESSIRGEDASLPLNSSTTKEVQEILKNVNPSVIEVPLFSKFFVIKSYEEEDVHRSIKYSIWTSTDNGNKRLDKGYQEANEKKASVFLLFSVNTSGQFCGVAEMISPLDYNKKSSVWNMQGKWNGEFQVKWVFIKDIPNSHFRHIRIPNNENKPVTNSRDAQEIPFEAGFEMINLFRDFRLTTSILDDFEHYNHKEALDKIATKGKDTREKKSEEEHEQSFQGRGRGRGTSGSRNYRERRNGSGRDDHVGGRGRGHGKKFVKDEEKADTKKLPEEESEHLQNFSGVKYQVPHPQYHHNQTENTNPARRPKKLAEKTTRNSTQNLQNDKIGNDGNDDTTEL